MKQTFDSLSQYEVPEYILCNPDGSKLFALGGIYERQVSLRYNAVSTIKFTAPKTINGTAMPYYSYLVGKRRIQIPDIGMFIITKVIEKSDGAKIYKEVQAKSLEFELSFRRIINLVGTWKFYDTTDSSKSLMHKVLSYMPGWTFGIIDTPLWDLHRTFNEKDTTVYTFLMREMEQAYQCIFTFDTLNKKVNAYAITNAITKTDIYLSYGNLLKNVDIDENSDDIVTALSVYGKGELTINQVNPLGNDIIYNFSHYMTTEWMSQTLINKINAWKTVINNNRATYSNTLTSWMAKNVQLSDLNNAIRNPSTGVPNPTLTGLYALETYLLEVQNALKLAIDSGDGNLTDEQAAVTVAEGFIVTKKTTIMALQLSMDGLQTTLTNINNLCKLEANFTVAELAQLSNFIFAGTYDNRNFLQTSEMTLEEIQQMALDLYNQGVVVSNKVSQPVYEFSLDIHNFIFIKYFQPFIDQLALGSSLYVQLEEGKPETLFVPVILGFDYNYDDPSSFKFLLSNRMRLANSEVELADINSEADRTISQVKFNAGEWSDWIRSGQQTVNQYIDEALNNSLATLIATKDQEIVINNNGLIGRQKDGGIYKPQQIWLTSNQLAFTNDNWQSVKMAVGKTTFGNQEVYGVVGDAIVGRIIAGNNLIIENNVNSALSTFKVDGNGVVLTNLDLILQSSNKNAQVIMKPTVPFLAQKWTGTAWEDRFRLTENGEVTMKGTVTASAGKIGTWNIVAEGLDNGIAEGTVGAVYIKPNKVKIGGMTYTKVGTVETTTFTGALIAATGSFTGAVTATSGTFTGAVVASSLRGTIDWSFITNAPSFATYLNGQSGYSLGGFTLGSLAPTRIGSGRWSFGTGEIGDYGTGAGILRFNSGGEIQAGTNGLGIVSSGTMYVEASSSMTMWVGTNLVLNPQGNLWKKNTSSGSEILSKAECNGIYAQFGHNHDGIYLKTLPSVATFTSISSTNINASTYTNGVNAGVTASFGWTSSNGSHYLVIKGGIVTTAY